MTHAALASLEQMGLIREVGDRLIGIAQGLADGNRRGAGRRAFQLQAVRLVRLSPLFAVMRTAMRCAVSPDLAALKR